MNNLIRKSIAVVVFLVLMFIATYFGRVSRGGLAHIWFGYTLAAMAFIFTPMIWKGKLALGSHSGSPADEADPRNPTISPQEESSLYAKALQEAESGSPDPGTWARAFADADGDLSRTKARYIKLRVAQQNNIQESHTNADSILAAENERLLKGKR